MKATSQPILYLILFNISFLFLFPGCKKKEAGNSDIKKTETLTKFPKRGFKDFNANSVFTPAEMTSKAIQKAIDDASGNGGGTVVLKAGVIEINEDINLRSNVKIKGELNPDQSLSTTIKAGKKLYQALIVARGDGVQNTAVEDLIIDGNNFDQHGVSFIYGTDNFLVRHCKIINIGYEKIDTHHEIKRAKNPTAINMWSEESDFTDNFTIEENTIISAAKHGINVNNGRNFILRNNYIEKTFMGWDASTGSDNAEIYGNEVVDCLFGAKTHEGKNLLIHNNHHHNLDDQRYFWEGWADNSGTAFVLQGPGVTATVTDNVFSGTAESKGIVFWDQDSTGIILKNNDLTPSLPKK
jgi:parallel beta-helix repeat protein